jgi:N-acyl-D-amino-acid deacylase
MRQNWTMTSTDGDLVPMGQGKPRPPAYGALPRKIRVCVNDRRVVEMPLAMRSMTSLPAAVFGLKDRGAIPEGCSPTCWCSTRPRSATWPPARIPASSPKA